MPNYKLLTPGPLTTTDTVKKKCSLTTAPGDDDYKKITLSIREKLLKLGSCKRACIYRSPYAGHAGPSGWSLY